MIRVSTMLADYGLVGDTNWFKEEHRLRGQAVHWIGEQVFRRRSFIAGPDYDGYRAGLESGRDHLDWQPVTIEERFTVEDLTGRPDTIGIVPRRVGKVHAGPAILDIKSGAPYPSHAIQLMLYEMLAEHCAIRDRLPKEWRDFPMQRIGLYVDPSGRRWIEPYTEPWDRPVAQSVWDLTRWRIAKGLLEVPGDIIDDPAEAMEMEEAANG